MSRRIAMFGKKKRTIENMSLLCSVRNDTIATGVESLLTSYDIASQLVYDGLDPAIKVILGKSNLGVDIYVKNVDYDKARMIIENKTPENETEDE